MKITENVELINAEKVTFGERDIKLTLDTETGQLSVDAPAMFTNPVVLIDLLQEKIDQLKSHMDR